MAFREKLRNPFVQQYLIEILFPLLGYFFFEWSLTVIAVFYLVDQLSSELVYFRRLHWINKHQELAGKEIWIVIAILAFIVLFTVELVILHEFWLDIFKSSKELVKQEILTFAQDELWFLFPVVVLVYHFKDQFTFYMPRRYLNYNLKKTVIYKTIETAFILALIISGLMLWKYTALNELVVLFGFIVIKVVFDLTISKWTDRKSQKLS